MVRKGDPHAHAIVGLDGSLRQELELAELDGIHVCTVMPMSHDTPFGAAGKLFSAGHAFMRDPMEKMMALNAYRAMIQNSPSAVNTRGNLGDPVEQGRGVSGGRKT